MSPRRRYITTTLILLLSGVAITLIQGRAAPSRPGPAMPSAARPVAPPPVPPSAREVLDRTADLGLSTGQVKRLQELDRRWEEERTILDAATHAASREFARFMEEATAGGGASLPEIQRRSADLADVSLALREARRLHADRAGQVLTESQMARVRSARDTHTRGGVR